MKILPTILLLKKICAARTAREHLKIFTLTNKTMLINMKMQTDNGEHLKMGFIKSLVL